MPQSRIACFALNLPLYQVFDYQLPGSLPRRIGCRYQLPFGSGNRVGILLDQASNRDIDDDRIREAAELLDEEAAVSPHLLSLAKWIADYYWQPIGDVLFQCLPGYLRSGKPQQDVRLRRWKLLPVEDPVIEQLQRRAPRQYELIKALQNNGSLTDAELRSLHAGWRPLVKSLQQKGVVEESLEEQPRHSQSSTTGPPFSDEQQRVYQAIRQHAEQFAVHVINGVTGSGKTEVYLRLIEDTLRRDQQVIYLVPEIGLTSQLVDRVQRRFEDLAVVSHSGLTDWQRYLAWERFRRGLALIMLGTRSSLFAQSEKLGLIIVDEEHDHSYRQDDGVRYQARDVAIKRAQMLDIPVVLGSATPSLETLANSSREHYHQHRLLERPAGFSPPQIKLVDTRNTVDRTGCSVQMLSRVQAHLQDAGQVLIYLNRRGFAPLMMCHECGWQAECPHCDARLTLHQSVQQLICHHCGTSLPLPKACPSCGETEIRHYGVGTEQLAQLLAERFPGVPILRIDRDVIHNHQAMQQRLRQLQAGEPCMIIGTQMIAKGHDYPGITLSVIVDADQALFSASYRATEQLAQTVFQVSGRAGRGDRAGEALLQTRFPDHPFLQSLVRGDYQPVAQALLAERQLLGFPPYSRVIMFRADAARLEDAIELLEVIKAPLAGAASRDVQLIGPMPALMTRRIGRYRAQLCLISTDFRALRALLQQSANEIRAVRKSAKATWTIDVDATDL